MSQKPVVRASVHELLVVIDIDLAESARRSGCPHCGSSLHRADFPRQPRGVSLAQRARYTSRISLCCAAEGCRRRRTPPSVRFLARRVYLGGVVVLLAAMTHGLTPSRRRRLQELVGADRRTVARWREWWREKFVATPFWRTARLQVPGAHAPEDLPGALLGSFAGGLRHRLLQLLRFLAPVSTACDPPFRGS